MMMALDSYVTGMARTHVLYANAAEETGLSDEEFWRLQVPVLERAMATGNYPAMAALSENAFDAGWDETFEFGLARLLDGLESFVERIPWYGRSSIALSRQLPGKLGPGSHAKFPEGGR